MRSESAERAAVVIALVVCTAVSAGPRGAAAGSPSRPVELIWAAETSSGLEGNGIERAFNPASVVKLATALRALEELGPDHRFTTRFGVRGNLDRESGVLHGDLIVGGGADPDFHVENGWLVGRELNRAGLRSVQGRLVVDGRFWLGWEGGGDRREPDSQRRARRMAARLRELLDPGRRGKATRSGLERMAARRGWDELPQAGIVVRGGAVFEPAPQVDRWLVVHRSNPLADTLKRFVAYSNNDIERLSARLGDGSSLAGWLRARWGLEAASIEFSSLSGLGRNRMTPRLVMRLLEDFQRSCERFGLDPADLLPIGGCDPGTLGHYPRLVEGPLSRAVVAKTGTLRQTDGGVTVLAGYLSTVSGERTFCVAAPHSGTRISAARREVGDWLGRWAEAAGGPSRRDCGAPVVHSDLRATVDRVEAAADETGQ